MPPVIESRIFPSSFDLNDWNSFHFLDKVRSRGTATALSARILALLSEYHANTRLHIEYELRGHIDDTNLRINARGFGCMILSDPEYDGGKNPEAIERGCADYLQLGADQRFNSEEDLESFSYQRSPMGGSSLPGFLSAHFEHGARKCDLSFETYVEKLENDPNFLASQQAWLLLPVHISITPSEEFKSHEISGGFSGGIAGFAIWRPQFLSAAPALSELLCTKERVKDYRLTAVCAGCGPEANEAYGYAMILDNFLRSTALERAREAGITDDSQALTFAKEWYQQWKVEVIAQSISLEHLLNAASRTERNYTQREHDWIVENSPQAAPFLEGTEYFLQDRESRHPHAYRIKTHIHESVSLEWCDLLHPEIGTRRVGEVDLIVAKRSLYLYSSRNNPKVAAACNRLVEALRPGGVLITDRDITRWPIDGLKPRHEASIGLYWSHPDMEELPFHSDQDSSDEKVFRTGAELQAFLNNSASTDLDDEDIEDDLLVHKLGYGEEIDAHEGKTPSGVYIKKASGKNS